MIIPLRHSHRKETVRGRSQQVVFAPFGLQGLLYFNARLRMLEKRQQQIRELKNKHERLKVELEEAKSRLMLNPSKWSGECEY